MARFFTRVASVEGRESRLALWAEAITSLEPLGAAREIDAVVRGTWAGDSSCLVAYLPLLDLPGIASLVGPGRLADVLSAARDADLDACLLFLETPAPLGRGRAPGPLPDPILDTLTLGHRRAAARGPRNPFLERILKDPDPAVVREVLRNPGLRESEVLAIASRRPCPEPVFWLLVRCERWIPRPTVRRALVLNPHAPSRLAVGLLVTLSRGDVIELSTEEGPPECVRAAALQILRWRIWQPP